MRKLLICLTVVALAATAARAAERAPNPFENLNRHWLALLGSKDDVSEDLEALAAKMRDVVTENEALRKQVETLKTELKAEKKPAN